MAATIAGPIKVNVVKVTDPNFAGVYTGDFSYDDTHLTKVGTESMTANGGNGDRPGLLSLNFRFLDFAEGLTPHTLTLFFKQRATKGDRSLTLFFLATSDQGRSLVDSFF